VPRTPQKPGADAAHHAHEAPARAAARSGAAAVSLSGGLILKVAMVLQQR